MAKIRIKIENVKKKLVTDDRQHNLIILKNKETFANFRI